MDSEWRLETALDEGIKKSGASPVLAGLIVGAGGALLAETLWRRWQRARRDSERRFVLGSSEAVDDGMRRVLAGQLDHAVELLRGTERVDGAEAVHGARKALKRARAVTRVSRPLIGSDRYRDESRRLRDAGRMLSAARDAQVLLDTLSDIRDRFADELPPGVWARFEASLVAGAGLGGHDMAGPSPAQRAAAAAAIEQVRRGADGWLPTAGRGPVALAAGFDRIYRQGRKAARRARRKPSVENLHELRKRSKDLWYSTELLAESRPKPAGKLARRAKRLSQLLGDDHDLALLHERATSETGDFGPGERELLDVLLSRRRSELRAKALKQAARVYRREPRQVMRKLGLA